MIALLTFFVFFMVWFLYNLFSWDEIFRAYFLIRRVLLHFDFVFYKSCFF